MQGCLLVVDEQLQTMLKANPHNFEMFSAASVSNIIPDPGNEQNQSRGVSVLVLKLSNIWVLFNCSACCWAAHCCWSWLPIACHHPPQPGRDHRPVQQRMQEKHFKILFFGISSPTIMALHWPGHNFNACMLSTNSADHQWSTEKSSIKSSMSPSTMTSVQFSGSSSACIATMWRVMLTKTFGPDGWCIISSANCYGWHCLGGGGICHSVIPDLRYCSILSTVSGI